MISILIAVITVLGFVLGAYVILWLLEMVIGIPPRIKQLVLVLALLIGIVYAFNHHHINL